MSEAPRIEGFRILEELGSGALSTVYKAEQEPLGRIVAVKLLKPTISPSSPFAAQLEREARVLGELSHPNVGLLYDFVKTESRMYIVLEYVDGFSLAAIMKKRPTVPPDVVAAIGAEVARGLAHAHERGIVHRDIKPANILISKRGEVKLFDFGIAQRARLPSADEPMGAPYALKLEDHAAFGTPVYMSPEQILGEVVGARSDIFSLGVVMYQLLCGARPFERGDETDRKAAAHRIRRDPAIPLHRRAADVPRALERVVMRAIEKLPVDRFASAEALAAQLDEFVEARTGARPAKLAAQVLEHAGLAATGASSAEIETRAPRMSVRPTIAGLVALCIVAMGGGAAIQASASHDGQLAGDRPLELLPAGPGYLRVLATPWAEVWIDGQRIDVTPFARAIPLTPGTHWVTLVHPNAPAEKRMVGIVASETRTLDVVMSVKAPPPQPARLDAGAPDAPTDAKMMKEASR
jgi:serine/threonine-protein kinase